MNARLYPLGDSEVLGHRHNPQAPTIKELIRVVCDAFSAAIGLLQEERIDVVGLGKEIVEGGIRVSKALFRQLDETMPLPEQRVTCPAQLGRMR